MDAASICGGFTAVDRRTPNVKAAVIVPVFSRRFLSSRRVVCQVVSRDLTPVSAASSGEEASTPSSVAPVYTPTPPNRELRTPHSGYHFDGTTRMFFEGWYFKVSIPEIRQSFCFMYSVENPAFPNGMGTLDTAIHGARFTGVGAQILGPDDKYICQFTKESKNFWGSRHELTLGNTFVIGKGNAPDREVEPKEFRKCVLEGFQVSPLWNQGFIRDDGRTLFNQNDQNLTIGRRQQNLQYGSWSNSVQTVKTARWEYSTRPVYGWGDVNSKQKSTAGWLAAFPVFEPHWQICMAGGLSTGWIEWDGERFEFENAPSYSEKNWGAGFPRKWFWVQCNVFEGASGEVALTAAGGLRKLSGLSDTYENAALIGVHYGASFYEFVPWNGNIRWEIAPWGFWHVSAENGTHVVDLEATTKDPGTPLRAPTMEAGFVTACKDTCFADLRLQLWERNYDGSKGKMILNVTSNMAAVEVGGGPWFSYWKGTTTTPELVMRAIRIPVDPESLFPLPFLKPPGL